MAEIAIDQAAIRAVLQRTCLCLDAFHAQYAGSEPPMAEAHELRKDRQRMKWLVHRTAIDKVSLTQSDSVSSVLNDYLHSPIPGTASWVVRAIGVRVWRNRIRLPIPARRQA
jgi:hypothetical protein